MNSLRPWDLYKESDETWYVYFDKSPKKLDYVLNNAKFASKITFNRAMNYEKQTNIDIRGILKQKHGIEFNEVLKPKLPQTTRHGQLQVSHRPNNVMISDIAKFNYEDIKDAISYDKIKDNFSIIEIKSVISDIKKKYPKEKLTEERKKYMLEDMEDAKKTFENNEIIQYNTQKFIVGIREIVENGSWYPYSYFEECKKIVMPHAYHLIGNPNQWFSFYVSKEVFKNLLDFVFDEVWYCTFKGSVGVGIIGELNTNSKTKEDDYVGVGSVNINFGTEGDTENKEEKTNEPEKVSRVLNTEYGRVSINEGEENYKFKSNNEFKKQLEKAIQTKRSFQTRLDCQLYAGYNEREEGYSILDFSKPGILKGVETITQGLMTYSFRGAAANLFKKFQRITGSSKGRIKGLENKSRREITNIFQENKMYQTHLIQIENTTYITNENDITYFIEYNGGTLTNDNSATDSTNTVINLSNTTSSTRVNNNTMNDTNTYQEISAPTQPGTEMEEIQEEEVEQQPNN